MLPGEVTRAAVRAIAGKHDLSFPALLARDRRKEVRAARLEVMKYLHDERGFSWTQVGRFLGLHHATVLNAVRRTTRAQRREQREAENVERMAQILGASTVRLGRGDVITAVLRSHGLDAQRLQHLYPRAIERALEIRMKAPPTEEHVANVCKPNTSKACRYLAKAMEGWSCEKHTGIGLTIDAKIARGGGRARGDNCEGKGSR